jgi:50S ribosomal subunit-associated GTPase HflX
MWVQKRGFGYVNTLSYRLYGPKRTVMVIHPMLQARQSPRLRHLIEADEALGLARAAKLDIVPGPTEPRMGWDTQMIGAQLLPQSSAVSEYVTVPDSEAESDDEMDMDDPLWGDPEIRKRYAESALVRLDEVDPIWFFGKGKVEEIAISISRMPPRYVFINATLTQVQIRQLEEAFYGGLLAYNSGKKQEYLETSRAKQMVGYRGDDEADRYEERISTYTPKSIEVFDRNRMILEIFARRANSPIAKLQCDIAKMNFVKANMGTTNLRMARQVINSLQTYVTPFKETSSTVDDGIKVNNSMYSFTEHKEKVDTLIRKLNLKMADATRARAQHRRDRTDGHCVTIGLVGYTNAGKTQLMNQLTSSDLRVRDLLFQTLDSSSRKFILPNQLEVVITDSIGFIDKLPHFLFHAFKATIDDLVHCDFLLHVRDISHPLTDMQADAVKSTLLSAGFSKEDLENRIIEVWNKIDDVDDAELEKKLETSQHVVPVSALTGDGIDDLVNVIETVACRLTGVERRVIKFPLNDVNKIVGLLREIADAVYHDTLACDASGEFMSIDVLIRPENIKRIEKVLLE